MTSRLRSPVASVLVALVVATALGVVASHSAPLAAAARAVEPLGTLWVNAIRMTVIPLVVASLVAGVTSGPDVQSIGRLGARALPLFLVALLVGAAYAAIVGPPLLRIMPATTGPSVLQPSTAATSAKLPTVAEWIVSLVPTNPVQAAADGAMIPLILFTLAFGLALAQLDEPRRAPVVAFFRAVMDASLTLVRWVLALAPLGVFALALPLATRLGASAAGAVASYVGVTALATTLFMALVLYPAAVVLGRVSPAAFARAALPAQAVAFSSRSSLAALPAMMETARDRLHLPPAVTGFVLPIAAATFRVGGAVGQTIGVLFLAKLAGVALDPARTATVIATMIAMTFSIPGVPGGSIIAMVPVLVAAGIPVEGVGILLGVDVIPDMFRTTCNVTGDLVVATILGRRSAHGSAGT